MSDKLDSYTFREIDSTDMQSIFDVRVATWHNDRGLEELNELGITATTVRKMMRNKTHRGWLCEDDSSVVGFAIGNQKNGEMWVIAVRKEHESHGIGRKLLTLVENWLFESGWEEIWLTTDPDESLRAVGFYRRLGWIDWKIENGDRFMRKQAAQSTHVT